MKMWVTDLIRLKDSLAFMTLRYYPTFLIDDWVGKELLSDVV